MLILKQTYDTVFKHRINTVVIFSDGAIDS